MGSIGIVCNPQSGKDIRRLLTAATTIDDTEKTNILERILISAASVGEQKVYLMPDRLGYGRMLCQKRNMVGYYGDFSQLEVYDMPITETQADTTHFVESMHNRNADVLIIMGGDGTNRAAAKGGSNIPTISISTGTNNVFPEMIEGTIAGLAAAVIANKAVSLEECTYRAKRIEIYKNGIPADIALIDLVFCRNPFVGSKAIWNYAEIDQIVVTQCHFATIGFSALIGSAFTVERDDRYGAVARFIDGKPNTFAPMGAGNVCPICIQEPKILPLDKEITRIMDYQGTLALDGEREVTFNRGDTISCKVTADGPVRVDVRKTVQLAMENNYFKI